MPKELDAKELSELPGEYDLRAMTPKEEKKYEDADILAGPAYKVNLDLTEEQKSRLNKQFKEEFEAIIAERESLGLPSKWESLDRQYDGEMRRNQKLQFNLHTQQSKIKVDAIVRALNEACLESSPMVDISPRPEQWVEQDKSGIDVCEKQQQFIDYEITENVHPERDLTLINLSAVKKFVGIGKIEWRYEKEKRRREEVYEGNNEIVYDQKNQPMGIKNDALQEFVRNYPDAKERYKGIYSKIAKGETVRIVVEYLDTMYNCAKLVHVPTEDFYVRNSTRYHEGLKKAHLIVERQTKTWFELEKKVRNGEFDKDAVDKLKNHYAGKSDGQSTTKQTYKTADYDILEATTYFNMDGVEDDDIDEDYDEDIKIKAWFAEINGKEKEYILLGVTLYPYYGFDIDYIPFYIKLNEDGFYGGAKSVLADLKDSNIAQDILLNLSLHSIYIRNVLTPIVPEGSDIAAAFIENRWQDGKPIEVDMFSDDVNKAIGFVEYPQINLQDFQVMNAQLQKQDGDVTGVSSLMSGRESPSDPHAPASKTVALLNQSSINIKDYIRQYSPSFNSFCSSLLQLYYQMSQEGRKYQVASTSKKVTGLDAFASISRDQMIAKTNIQSRASAFAFDKSMEKQENMAAFQLFGSTPVAATQPEAYYKALKTLLKSWSPNWANFVENDLMNMEDFNKKQMAIAMQAMGQLLKMQFGQAQVTGQQPQLPTPEQGGQAITQAQTMANNPALAVEAEKHNK